MRVAGGTTTRGGGWLEFRALVSAAGWPWFPSLARGGLLFGWLLLAGGGLCRPSSEWL